MKMLKLCIIVWWSGLIAGGDMLESLSNNLSREKRLSCEHGKYVGLAATAQFSPALNNLIESLHGEVGQECIKKGRSQLALIGHETFETKTLQPYCCYRFDAEKVRRPLTRLTGGSSVVFSALAVKELWHKKWSCEQEPEIFADSLSMQEKKALLAERIKEKSVLVRARVHEMVITYGEQEGEQIYLPDDALEERLGTPFFEGIEPFSHLFILNQERKMALVKTLNDGQCWEVHEDIAGPVDALKAFLEQCTHSKKESCACVIGTFVEPFVTYDRVLAVVCKKAGPQGPTFIYFDPLNRGMKKNPRAQLFVAFLLKQALAARSMPQEKGIFGRLLKMLPYTT